MTNSYLTLLHSIYNFAVAVTANMLCYAWAVTKYEVLDPCCGNNAVGCLL